MPLRVAVTCGPAAPGSYLIPAPKLGLPAAPPGKARSDCAGMVTRIMWRHPLRMPLTEEVVMATELVLLGTAGAPMPVAGRGGISSALVVSGRVFVIDCGRGSPSAFAEAGLAFPRLEAVFLTHLHADHIGDLPGMLLYPWGARNGDTGPRLRAGETRGGAGS